MARVEPSKKIKAEDFDEEYSELINTLAYNINSTLQEVTNALNGNIDFQNLKREIVVYDVEVDACRIPKRNTLISSKFNNPRGLQVLNYVNLDASKTYVTSAIQVSFTTNEKLITIKEVTGLTANTKYRLTLEVVP